MKKSDVQSPLVLIEWSPTRVRLFDPVTRQSVFGATIAECLEGNRHPKDAVIAISRRSSFIRTVPVPNAGRAEIEKALPFHLNQLLPIGQEDVVTGFRLTSDAPGKTRTAIVGAMKSASLRAIFEDAKAAGLRVRAVLPLAFGSWLAARAHSLSDCVVVEEVDRSLGIDVIRHGELAYSRFASKPADCEELSDEIQRTLETAQSDPLPVLTLAAQPGTLSDQKEAIEYLGDLHAIARHLFSFELPEKADDRVRRVRRTAAIRALAAAAVAVGLGVYGFIERMPDKRVAAITSKSQQNLVAAKSNLSTIQARQAELADAAKTLDAAFKPSQHFSDALAVLGSAAPEGAWFTEVTMGRGLPVVVAGLCVDDKAVADFAGDLAKNSRFSGMRVMSTGTASIGKQKAVRFSISGRLVGNPAFDKKKEGPKR